MDIFKFVDSRDIREHLRSIDYQFSTPEAAFLVWYSRKATLKEKTDAWLEIADIMPNCSMLRNHGILDIPDFHAFLRKTVDDIEEGIVKFEIPSAHSYFFDIRWPGQSPASNMRGPFRSYDACIDTAVDELLENEDASGACVTRFALEAQAPCGNSGSVFVNTRGEIMSCDFAELEGSVPAWEEAFNMMWFDFPTPFHAGDVVCTTRDSLASRPFVLTRISTWDGVRILDEMRVLLRSKAFAKNVDRHLEAHRTDGDVSDMCAFGCVATRSYSCQAFPIYSGDIDAIYLDLEYYRKPLEGADRMLLAVRPFVKGDLGFDSLVAFCKALDMQAQAKESLKEIRRDQFWLKDKYPELFED